ncbi:MAG: tail fiber domain-containing protein [Bacteroidales bacterium]|nr:tail fiber domain-containing protein [Bacteroidales bacterium]
MKKLLLLFTGLILSLGLLSQAPRGFNYQAVARDVNGNPISGQALSVRIGILQNEELIWQEEHNVTTSNLGLFTLIVGDPDAGGSGTAGSFDNIPWGEGTFAIKVDINDGSGYTDFVAHPLTSVPYALHAGNGMVQELILEGTELTISGGNTVSLADLPDEVDDADHDPVNELQDLIYSGGRITLSGDPDPTSINLPAIVTNESGWDMNVDTVYTSNPVQVLTKNSKDTTPLFEVKNDLGNPVFAVFNDGVMVYIDEGKKGVKGGFAVGGYNAATKGVTQEYIRVTPDSTQIYFKETTKGVKGGFAIGGYSGTKGEADQLMSITRQNYLIGLEAGLKLTTGYNNSFLGNQSGYNTTEGSGNIYIGLSSGFSSVVPRENIFIGNESGYMGLNTRGNVYVGNQAGKLGTTGDYNSFVGYKSGYNNTANYNSFFGFTSGLSNTSGAYNSFFGYRSGYNSTTGNYNTYIGYQAGYSGVNASGSNNVMIGSDAGYSNSTGTSNVFIGQEAGRLNTAGNFNAIIGYQAGYDNQGGDYNTFLGYQAGYNSEGSSYNTSVGYQAGYSLNDWQGGTYLGYEAGKFNTGRQNVFIGSTAGRGFTTGADNVCIGGGAGGSNDSPFVAATGTENVFIGYHTGYKSGGATHNVIVGAQDAFGGSTITGSYNVYLGEDAGNQSGSASNNVFLGYNAGKYETTSNKLYIDNTSTSTPLIWGDFYNNYLRFNASIGINRAYSSSYGVMVDGGSSTYYSMLVYKGAYAYGTGFVDASDARLKTNINTIDNALNMVKQLRGVRFNWDVAGNPDLGLTDDLQIGMIAQEVEAIVPEVVTHDPDGFRGISYGKLTAVLIEAIKEQQKQIEALEQRIAELEK